MSDVPSVLPTELVAGDTWQWDRELAGYPQPTWIATAFFEKADKSFSVVATQSGTAQRFTIAAATTAGYPDGRYLIRIRVTDGASVRIAESGWCDVEVDPASAGSNDPRSQRRRTLDAINAFLEGNASTAQQSMSIAGRSIQRWSLTELLAYQEKLEARVRADEGGMNGSVKSRDIKVRFS